MSAFLDLFTYESVTQGEQDRFLKPGDVVAAITIYLVGRRNYPLLTTLSRLYQVAKVLLLRNGLEIKP